MAANAMTRQVQEIDKLLKRREKKEKTSVSLSGEIVKAADLLAGAEGRSAFVEKAIRRYLASMIHRWRNQRDLELINASADLTNRESDAVSEFQAWPE